MHSMVLGLTGKARLAVNGKRVSHPREVANGMGVSYLRELIQKTQLGSFRINF